MSKKILMCEYCRHIITENDVKCPNCGANCSNVIRKYKAEMEEQEKIEKEKIANEEQLQKEKTQKAAKAVALGFGITSLVPIILFVVSIAFAGILIVANIRSTNNSNSTNKTEESVSGTIDEVLKEENYSITLDNYETYEYYHKNFTSCNTKEGYKKVAFYFTVENTGSKTMNSYEAIGRISAKADNEIIYQSSLEADDHFCEVVSGKANYNKLTSTQILAGDKVSGYIGYEIPVKAEKIKFIMDDDHIIEIDNPVYKKNEYFFFYVII